jgi:hypothetical protein
VSVSGFPPPACRRGRDGAGRTGSGGNSHTPPAGLEPPQNRDQLSLEALVVRIERAIANAERDGAHGAIASNHALILKIIEMVNEQNAAEHQFAGAMTADQIMELMIGELGPDDTIEIADKMREAAPNRQVEQALIVS